MSTSKSTPARGQGASKKRQTYPQNWRAYNAAQMTEKAHVADILRSLCDQIESPPQHRGRPRIPMGDAIFAAVMKVYGTASSRRTSTALREFEAAGYLDRAPHFNVVLKSLENPVLTPILKKLIEDSAAPLRGLETDFAADSSGFATKSYARWFNAKYGPEMNRYTWLKAHIVVGTRTNIVTSVEITESRVHDSKMLRPLLVRSAKNFNMVRVSADKGYLSRSNAEAIVALGAEPFMPPRSNMIIRRYLRPESTSFDRMIHYYGKHKEEFMRHYHRRSNVETTFHMIKSKFGSHLRSKTTMAQVNEVLCKVLCHNLCCLVHASYEIGIAS